MSPIYVGNRKISGSLASDPVGGSTSAGSIYYNTTDDKLRLYDGSSWTALGNTLGISQDNPITSFDQAGIDGVYWIRPAGTAQGSEFQTYINKSEGNGGWSLAWVVTNVNGDGVNWWNGDSSMSGNTGTDHFTSSTSTFGGTITTNNTKANAKNALFNTYQFTRMMIIENHSGTMGVKQYNMNTTQTFVHHFNNQSGNNLVSNVLKTSGSFTTFNTSSLYFNYVLGNDGARIAAATASSEAVGGISARVDGARSYSWKGNLTRNDSNRAYGSDGTTTDHTVWIYVQ